MSNDSVTQGDTDIKSKLIDFSNLVEKISGISSQKKKLFFEIYENAIQDRQNAYAMFVQLVTISQGKSSEHAIHGRSMSSYIERMSKANDQLLKLAEMIDAIEKSDDNIDPETLYRNIQKQ